MKTAVTQRLMIDSIWWYLVPTFFEHLLFKGIFWSLTQNFHAQYYPCGVGIGNITFTKEFKGIIDLIFAFVLSMRLLWVYMTIGCCPHIVHWLNWHEEYNCLEHEFANRVGYPHHFHSFFLEMSLLVYCKVVIFFVNLWWKNVFAIIIVTRI